MGYIVIYRTARAALWDPKEREGVCFQNSPIDLDSGLGARISCCSADSPPIFPFMKSGSQCLLGHYKGNQGKQHLSKSLSCWRGPSKSSVMYTAAILPWHSQALLSDGLEPLTGKFCEGFLILPPFPISNLCFQAGLKYSLPSFPHALQRADSCF